MRFKISQTRFVKQINVEVEVRPWLSGCLFGSLVCGASARNFHVNFSKHESFMEGTTQNFV